MTVLSYFQYPQMTNNDGAHDNDDGAISDTNLTTSTSTIFDINLCGGLVARPRL